MKHDIYPEKKITNIYCIFHENHETKAYLSKIEALHSFKTLLNNYHIIGYERLIEEFLEKEITKLTIEIPYRKPLIIEKISVYAHF